MNVVQHDLTLAGGWTGAGILLVEGNLTLSGKVSFDGLLLVIGKGTSPRTAVATLRSTMTVAGPRR